MLPIRTSIHWDDPRIHLEWLQVAPLDPLLSDQLSSMGQEVPNKRKTVWEDRYVFFVFVVVFVLFVVFVCLFVGWLVAWLLGWFAWIGRCATLFKVFLQELPSSNPPYRIAPAVFFGKRLLGFFYVVLIGKGWWWFLLTMVLYAPRGDL